jgi:hypothetical protein
MALKAVAGNVRIVGRAVFLRERYPYFHRWKAILLDGILTRMMSVYIVEVYIYQMTPVWKGDKDKLRDCGVIFQI